MAYIQEVYLDINPNDSYTIITAKQFDADSRGIRAHITQNGQTYSIANGSTFKLRVMKPDGHVVIKEAIINNDQSITAIFNEQCLLVDGRAYADLVEFNDGYIISTAPFIIDIKPSPNLNKTHIESVNEYAVLYDLIYGAQNAIGDAEAWANGTRNDILIDSNEKAYNKNAKYWASKAEDILNSINFSIIPETGNLTITFEKL